MTFLGAQRESNPFNWYFLMRDVPQELYRGQENWSVNYHGLSITNEVRCSGYENVGPYLMPVEGETQSYSRVLTIAQK